MGMFDYVNFKMVCPGCGRKTANFQSKDGDCCLNLLEPEDVDEFYYYCRCGKFLEFRRTRPNSNHTHREVPLSREQVEALGFALTQTPL